MDSEVLTVKEAAVRLGRTTRTVRLWIESGRLSAERVDGKFGPEWRVPRTEVERVAAQRSGEPLSLDLARKPGGNDLRALAAVLTTEIQQLHAAQMEQSRFLAHLGERLEELARALPEPRPDPGVEGLIRQGAQVQQTVEEEARARHRDAQELQAALQGLRADLHAQAEQVAELAAEIASLRARPVPWYRRLFPR